MVRIGEKTVCPHSSTLVEVYPRVTLHDAIERGITSLGQVVTVSQRGQQISGIILEVHGGIRGNGPVPRGKEQANRPMAHV